MFGYKKHQAEGWKMYLTSACFIFISFFSISIGFSQNQEDIPTRSIIGFPVFTSQHTVRCAEGELGLFFGEDRTPITPIVWQSPKPGQIHFQVDENEYRLEFNIAYAETLSASHAVSGVILHCTASSLSNTNSQAVVWCAWNHNLSQDEEAFGVALVSSVQKQIAVSNHPDPWHPASTWYFQEYAFVSNHSILYWVNEPEGWDITHHVRNDSPPYASLEPSHWIGWTKLSASIKPNQPLSFRVLIPYFPISKE